jgi:hypothetical protein
MFNEELNNQGKKMKTFKSLQYSEANGKFTFEAINTMDKNLYKDLITFCRQYRTISKYDQHLLWEIADQLRRGQTMTIML